MQLGVARAFNPCPGEVRAGAGRWASEFKANLVCVKSSRTVLRPYLNQTKQNKHMPLF